MVMKSIPVILFVIAILMTSIVASTLPVANALYRNMYDDSHATARFGNSKVCGDHICGPGEYSKMIQKINDAQKLVIKSTTPTYNYTYIPIKPVTSPITNQTETNQTSSNQTQTTPSTIQNMTMSTMVSPTWITKTGTETSIQDPGQGHESHQLVIILPPSDKIYSGVISWASSKPIQIVELTGPLGDGEDKGQPVWTTDGQIKFGFTLVDLKQSTGSFAFTGNALAIHYSDTTPFTISYSVSYMESAPSEYVKSGTLSSIQDPGQGHENHQLALILPPSDKPYHGILTYSASENVQLVSLIGPIDSTDKKGQSVYTMDGKTWFALGLVDPGTQMGTWQFSGNAIAIHTKNATQFHVSYTVDSQR
jgi:hypothetical protein